MATRQIKSVRDLPDWFCIDGYKEAETLDTRGWHAQLDFRSFCHSWLGRPSVQRKHALEHFEKMKHAIKMGRLPNGDYTESEFSKISKKGREINPFNTYSVESMSRIWAIAYYKDIDSEERAIYETKSYEQLTEEQKLALLSSYDLYHLQRGESRIGYAHVVVNLYATDEQILSDFKHWLAGFRQESGHPAPTKNFTRAQFARWHRHGVLPYLDLLLWSMVEEVSIADHVMGRAIFPEEYDVDPTDRIAKTTRKIAMKAIAGPTIAALYAQAVAERLAEQNSQKSLPE